MARFLRILGWTLGVLVGLVAVAIGAAYLYVTSDDFRTRVAGQASTLSGRQTKIGDLSVDWGWTPHVHLSDVELANAKWAKEPNMLKAERIDFDIRLWPLLGGKLVLPTLVLLKPELVVEKGDNDQMNWDLGEAPPAAAATKKAIEPDNRFETPMIGHLEITEGKLTFRDPKRKLDLDGTISTATGKAGAQPQAELQLKGKLDGQPLAVHFVGGSIMMLRDTNQPYPLDIDVTFGATKLKAKGTVMDPFQWTGADVQLAMSGHDLGDIYPLLGIPGPPTPPYNIVGKLIREDGIWKFVQSRWHVGDSDLTGEVQIDERKKPAQLSAKLVSQKLVFADLAPLIGAPPDKPGGGTISPQQRQTQHQLEASGDLFPNVPLEVEKLRAMNMDVSLDARSVIAPSYLPVQALSFRVVVQDGVATAKPLTLILLGDGHSGGAGKITGELVIDAKTDTPKVRANLALADMELRSFFRNSPYFDATSGKIQGRLALAGTGRSLAQVMGTADGHVAAALGGGSVSSLMVSLAGLQIFDALIIYVTGDHRIPIKCAVGRLNFNHGNVVFDRMLLDTQKSVLHVQGQASLVSQAIKAEVDADAKEFDLLDLHGAVMIQGKLRQPQVSLGRIFPIPTPVIGTAKDVACAQATQQLFSGN